MSSSSIRNNSVTITDKKQLLFLRMIFNNKKIIFNIPIPKNKEEYDLLDDFSKMIYDIYNSL